MEKQEKSSFRINPVNIRDLINCLKRDFGEEEKTLKAILEALEDSIKAWREAILSWDLVEAFVNEVCKSEEGEARENCRANIRALFQNLEKPLSLSPSI